MRKRSVLMFAMIALATAMTGIVAPSALADDSVAADCGVLGPIASGAISKLTPLQALPPDQAQAARDQYVGELQGQLSSVNSAQGQADLQAYINAVQSATSPADAQKVLNGIVALQTDCP